MITTSENTGTRLGGWIAVALALALAGCATRAEGDAVYMKQHRASIALTQVVLVAELENPAIVDMLYDSETALNVACKPLQEAAYRKLTKEPVDPVLKLQAYGALDSCEAKAREIEDLLWRIDPRTAGHYLDNPLVSVRAPQ
ncbi:MAG: hypothetical protein OEU09_14380 [Rhodospirillales bacterium]|nr:hypothetical protein [Rhodospirillales bacterium]MDH3912476.1 hypothetical protein [Rhodospirillales bacterium]MDH3920264.1 hypothetical protein [Rhodospirillales bacterium]